MLRQLLTVLALFTGLAAVAEPVHAARMASGVESVSLTEQGPSCQAVAKAGIAIGSRMAESDPPAMCMRPVLPIQVPTVMLQADRARE